MVNTDLLKKYIEASGLKVGFICEKLGISRTSFDNKRKGKISFRTAEVNLLCELLRIYDPHEKCKIFYAEVG